MQQENTPVTPRLTEEQLQRSVERLTRCTNKQASEENKPQTKSPVISKEEMERHIKHLYDDSLAHKQMEYARIAQAEEAALRKGATLTTHVLSSEEVESMVRRLYEDSAMHKTQTMHELSMQMLSKSTVNSSSSKVHKLSQAEEKEAVDRYYKGGMNREREKQIALFEKYVLARRDKSKSSINSKSIAAHHENNSNENETAAATAGASTAAL